MGSWGDISNAQAMRDALARMIESSVDDMRPGNRPGTVLRVYQSGATFNTSAPFSLPDPSAAPPQSPGNPTQVWYADVRLDTGDVIRARLQQDIPYARDASWWDTRLSSAQTQLNQTSMPYFIADGVYRNAITVVRTDYNGNPYNSVEPDFGTHVTGFPYVPPRVSVEGTAGKYVINEIIRGITSSQDALLQTPTIVGGRKAGIQTQPGGGKVISVTQEELTWNKQGWVGNTGFYAAVGAFGKSPTFEVELTYADSYQKYVLNTKHVRSVDWGKWMFVPPVYETYTPRSSVLSTDQTKNVLLANIDTGGVLHLYVASASFSNTPYTATDLYLNGTVTVRSTSGPLVPAVNISMPALPSESYPKYVWGFTNSTASPLDIAVAGYARPAFRSSFSQDLLNLKTNLCFGTVQANVDTSGGYRLLWDKANTYTAKSVFKGSGYFDIMYPAVGTTIPITNNEGVTYTSVMADGIPFAGYYSLYYCLPIGANTGAQSVDSNFVLVDPNSDFEVPEHWILIASRPNVSPTPVAPPSTTVPVNVRVAAGNFHGAYSTSDSSRMAQVPYQVGVVTGSYLQADIICCSELHEENNMHQYFLTQLRKTDSNWALAEGDGGNQLLYRPSLYVVTNVVPMQMPTGRNLTDFTVQDKQTGFEFHALVTHTRADDDDGTSRDSERLQQITFIANYMKTLQYAFVGGDFNFKQDTNVSLRNIIQSQTTALGLQFRTANIAYYNKDSISGSTGTNFSGNARWPDDIFVKSAQTVSGSAGVLAGNASDHYLWVRTTVGFLNDGSTPTSVKPGASFQLGNGREIDTWHQLNAPAGYVQATDHPFQYKRENGRALLRGGLKASGAKNSPSTMTGVMPIGLRPSLLNFGLILYASYTPGRADIYPNGNIVTRVDVGDGDNLFFDNISYSFEQ